MSPGYRLRRRALLQAGAASALVFGEDVSWAKTGPAITFPRDAGAHPNYATEWWYVTGSLNIGNARLMGFQVTFFRRQVPDAQTLQSNLAARQLLFAHAALTDVQAAKLTQAQRVDRWSGRAPGTNPVDTSHASTLDNAITLRDWSLTRQGDVLQATVKDAALALNLRLTASQSVLLQGAQGWSRKGPQANQGSFYYSLPQLQVQGEVVLNGQRYTVQPDSTAWLDHEWSQAPLPPGAVGWDWIGMNFLDGSALTAFQLRTPDGGVLWDGGSFRSSERTTAFARGEAVFTPVRFWRSPLGQAQYPVEYTVRTPAGLFTVTALVDNQELDSRASTGAIYWEGLCDIRATDRRLVGRGYLEMTGYASPLTM